MPDNESSRSVSERSGNPLDSLLTVGQPDAYLDLFGKLLLDTAIHRLLAAKTPHDHLELFHQLLLAPDHRCHQQIAERLQHIGSPSTVNWIRKVLERGYGYLDYTGLDCGALTRWFAQVLWAIGTTEALAVIHEYAGSPDEGMATEMMRWQKCITASERP